MKQFLKHNGLWILFAAVVLSVALAALSLLSTTSSPLVNLINTVASPFRETYAAVAGWISDKQNYYEDNVALKEENQQLKEQLAEMEELVRQAQAALEENVFLRDLLDLRQQRRDLTDFETAAVIEHEVTNWTSSLTLNKGTDHGVEVGDCVIDGSGNLVGLIYETGVNWSTVLTLVDTDTSIGAKVFRTGDLVLAEGNLALMGDGLLRLNHLPEEGNILTGDLVVTSGLGGFLPPDLVLGSVKELQSSDSGGVPYAVLEPAADFDALTEVCIIKSFTIVP